MGRKLEAVLLWGGGAGPHITQCGQDRVLPAHQVSSWSVEPFGHNTPTSQTGLLWRSVTLICGALEEHLLTYLLTGQTGQTDRQRSDSIGRTVLQTVAQKG